MRIVQGVEQAATTGIARLISVKDAVLARFMITTQSSSAGRARAPAHAFIVHDMKQESRLLAQTGAETIGTFVMGTPGAEARSPATLTSPGKEGDLIGTS